MVSKSQGESSREAAKGSAGGEVTGVMDCPFLLSTFSCLRSMAGMPWPPHPRPLSTVGGEGRILCFFAAQERQSTPRP